MVYDCPSLWDDNQQVFCIKIELYWLVTEEYLLQYTNC